MHEALDIICKNIKKECNCKVLSNVYDLKERAPNLQRVLAVTLPKRDVECDKTGENGT